MNILQVSDYYPPCFIGGAEIYAHRLSKSLIKEGHSVKVITNSSSVKCDKDYIYENVPVHVIKTRYSIKDIPVRFFNPWVFKKSMQIEDKPDFIHLHNFTNLTSSIIFALKKKFQVPIVWTTEVYIWMQK